MEKLNLKLLKNQKFHFIGIGGISMSGLAACLLKRKFLVSGSDLTCNNETKKLEKMGAKIHYFHDEKNIEKGSIVVFSSAIKNDNPELSFALKNEMTILKRSELLGLICDDFKNVIAISGSHGKTTATAMIAEIFVNAGLCPTIHLGGVLKSINSNYFIGKKNFFIVEACEYMDNFLNVKPDVSVVLNIDSDHLDYFGDLGGVKKSFLKFANGTKNGGVVVVSADDENSGEIMKLENKISFGFNKKADIYATNVKKCKGGLYSFSVWFAGCKLGRIKLNILGKHNIFNALSAIAVSMCYDIDFEVVKKSIENFSGTIRRCQKIAEINGVSFFHDYAHHPKQIEKMIEVGRDLISKKGKLIVVFEPHTFSRTKFLFDDFSKALSKADFVIISPVYSARENESDGYSSLELLAGVEKYNKNVELIEGFEKIKNRLLELSVVGDVVLILGAGTIENLAKLLENKN